MYNYSLIHVDDGHSDSRNNYMASYDFLGTVNVGSQLDYPNNSEHKHSIPDSYIVKMTDNNEPHVQQVDLNTARHNKIKGLERHGV